MLEIKHVRVFDNRQLREGCKCENIHFCIVANNFKVGFSKTIPDLAKSAPGLAKPSPGLAKSAYKKRRMFDIFLDFCEKTKKVLLSGRSFSFYSRLDFFSSTKNP